MAHPVLQILNAGDIAELTRADHTDGQLLERFVKTRDADAFATLVRRHGALVLGVCRRVLHNPADVDDAFQAAFLVLARKAATIDTRKLLAPWLHGVAYNTARKLRRSNARRALREQPLASAPEPVVDESVNLRDELLAILDEELNQLPERYRVPIVLCDLEGSTRKEAARQIGCPEGTVAGRLARARALLAERLAGRGIVPTAGILAAILTQHAAGAIMPDRVMATVRAVSGGTVSIRVAELAERVVTAMFLTKLKPVAMVVLVCSLLAASVAGFFRADATATEPQAPFETARPADQKKAGEAKVLTVIPLRKLDPERTAKIIAETYKGKGVTVGPLVGEKGLLLYAPEQETVEIEGLVQKLGEDAPKHAIVIPLKKGTNATEAAKNLSKDYPEATVIPVPDDGVLLFYADRLTTKVLRVFPPVFPPSDDPKRPGKSESVPKTYTVKFQNAAWKDVIAWYADISGYKFVGDVLPVGSVTLQPPKDRQFTLGEITDMLNEALIQQKFLLIRRQTTFIIHPADEKVDPTLIPRVEVSDIVNRGKTELVEVEITLDDELDAKEIAPEIRRMLTPFGEVAYAKGKRLVVRDTAVNVMRIIKMLQFGKSAPEPGAYDPRFDPRFFGPRQPEPKKVVVNFKDAPWEDVLQWYAKESGLTPIITVKPTGRVTIQPPAGRKFTMGEVVDLLNEAMAQQKFILIRRQVTFYIHPADEKIDPSWVPRIDLDELPHRGKTELVQVLIPLKKLAVDDAVGDVQKMLSPYGMVAKLSKTNTLVILDTAGNLQRIYDTIQKVEKDSDGETLTHICKYKKAQEVADHLKTLLTDKTTEFLGPFDPRGGGQGGRQAGSAKIVQIAVDTRTNSVTITAPPEKIQLAKKIIEEFDRGAKPYTNPDPILKKYSVPAGTAEALGKALMAENPSLRIVSVPAANEIWVMATPEEHLILTAKLAVKRSETVRTVVIPTTFSDLKELAVDLRKISPSIPEKPIIAPGFWGLSAIIVQGTPGQIKDAREIIRALEGIK